MDSSYRYQLERYRGRSTRYVCPQCHRKGSFTRYIDTHNNNEYISDNVGKCNRLDKCGYHYTPRQYFEDNPWKKDVHRSLVHYHRENERVNGERCRVKPTPPKPAGTIPRWFMMRTLDNDCNYKRWLRARFGAETANRLVSDYYIGGNMGDADAAIFWQVDHEGNVRTGKVMNYDATTGKRLKGAEAYLSWVHSLMREGGVLPEGWELRQCLYGEHLLQQRPDAFVALAEGAKTAHIGAALMPELVWVAVDAMLAISEERLAPLKGRRVILFPDEGRGYREWSERIAPIAHAVGFSYTISDFMQRELPNTGGDIGDLALN